jgi:hypothetical protein
MASLDLLLLGAAGLVVFAVQMVWLEDFVRALRSCTLQSA